MARRVSLLCKSPSATLHITFSTRSLEEHTRYNRIGLDDSWQDCGKGVNGSFHSATGVPLINSKFPNMKAMNEYASKNGIGSGWCVSGPWPLASGLWPSAPVSQSVHADTAVPSC
jgi:hypothetical protein